MLPGCGRRRIRCLRSMAATSGSRYSAVNLGSRLSVAGLLVAVGPPARTGMLCSCRAWSFAREDFERRLHHKRAKVRVRFVELTNTIPVQTPESQVLGELVTNDFLALLDNKNRQIVVLLNSGVTRGTEIAKILGYANHSAVSKRLTQIRKAAARHLDLS